MPESSLEKLLRLADASMLEPAALGKVDKSEDDEVHEHLMRECPWYKNVSSAKCCSDPDEHCKDGGGALIKFAVDLITGTTQAQDSICDREHRPSTSQTCPAYTYPARPRPAQSDYPILGLTSRTPEASTVSQPTVPPGGPGLFHVKGLELPPYVQHLYKHLVARYGKEKAYGVAVGVVKKWAAGVNPGGKKPTHTHPDVRAAAAKNVAQWEADKAKAHAQSARTAAEHVRASVPQPSPMENPAVKILPLPAPPKQAAAIMTAHRVNGMQDSLSHAVERMAEARKAKDPKLRAYHSIHIRNHLSKTLGTGHMLADNLRRNYPAEGRELDAVMKTLGLARSLSPALKASTTSHLLETILNECTHAARHAQCLGKTEPRDQWEFNADHTEKHLHSALEHACKLHDHIMDNYPAEARQLAGLHDLVAGKELKAAAPGGPTLTKAEAKYRKASGQDERCGNCSMATGWHAPDFESGTCSLVKGLIEEDHVCDHWEKDSKVAAAAPAAQPSGKPYDRSFLTPQKGAPVTISAPGAGKPLSYGQLKQEPSQTVSPSPPLPPKVDLPTPKELRAFAKRIKKMADDDDHHLAGAQMHLESAADKMATNPVNALMSLRSAQMAIQQAWRFRVQRAHPRIAYVFSANTPPAEQSSQQQVWAEEQSRIGEMQGAASVIATFIDRVRRSYFSRMGMENQTAGGGLAGQPNARL